MRRGGRGGLSAKGLSGMSASRYAPSPAGH